MSPAQRKVLGVLLVVVFLDLAVSQRLQKLWNHAFTKTTTNTSSNINTGGLTTVTTT